jgi:high-affinity iron transporter
MDRPRTTLSSGIRRALAGALLAVASLLSLGLPVLAAEPGVVQPGGDVAPRPELPSTVQGRDPMERYLLLIERIRGELTETLDLYLAGDRTGSFRAARAAYLDAFEIVEFPLRDRDPDLTLEMEDAFARLRTDIRAALPASVITDDVARLQDGMDEVEGTLSMQGYAPVVVAGTAFGILFRGGLEAVLLLSSVLGYLAASRALRYRRVVLAGAATAAAATVATWFLLQALLQVAPVRPAVVRAIPALVAVVVLVAFSSWLLSRLDQRRWLEFMSARVFAAVATGGSAALFVLGFTAVYRQGFESVAFLQALLAYSHGVEGPIAFGAIAAAAALGWVTWAVLRFGRHVPLHRFVAITVVLVMAISVAFVGNGVRSLQEGYVVPLTNLTGSVPRLPFHLAQATGYHPTLETLAAQVLLVVIYGGAAGWVLLTARRGRAATAAGPAAAVDVPAGARAV